MSRLIDANSLQRLFDTLSKNKWNKSSFTSWAMAYEAAKAMVDDEVTVDAVPVVRCKDCKFYRKTAALAMDYFDYIEGNTENKKPVYMCDNDVIDWPTPEDYCSHGRRREDAKTADKCD